MAKMKKFVITHDFHCQMIIEATDEEHAQEYYHWAVRKGVAVPTDNVVGEEIEVAEAYGDPKLSLLYT